MQRKHVYNLLTIAAIIVALGSDCLQSAGESVLPGAINQAVQKVATRFGRGLCRQVRFTDQRPALTAAVPARSQGVPASASLLICVPHQVGQRLLHLPPPLA